MAGGGGIWFCSFRAGLLGWSMSFDDGRFWWEVG